MYVSIGRGIVLRIYLVLAVVLEPRSVFVYPAPAPVRMSYLRIATKITKLVSKFVGVILAQDPPAPRLPRLHTKQRSTSAIENGRLRFANPPYELCRDWHRFPNVKQLHQFTEQHECLFLAPRATSPMRRGGGYWGKTGHGSRRPARPSLTHFDILAGSFAVVHNCVY